MSHASRWSGRAVAARPQRWRTVSRLAFAGTLLLGLVLPDSSPLPAQTGNATPGASAGKTPNRDDREPSKGVTTRRPDESVPGNPFPGLPSFVQVPKGRNPTTPASGQLPMGQVPMGQVPMGNAGAAGGGAVGQISAGTVPVQMLEQFLFRKDVISELGLIDDQIQTLTQRIQNAQQELLQAMRFPPGSPPTPQQIQDKMVRIHVQTNQDIERELLPHQRIRMKQLAIQMRYPGGNLRVYTSSEFLAALDYTPDQEAAIKAQQENTEKEIQLAVERLLADGRSRIQRLMTTEQRAKSEELLGPPFTFIRETHDEMRSRLRRR